MAWLSGWTKRRKITIDNTNIDSDLTHFPVPVPLGMAVGQSDVEEDDVSSIFDELGTESLKIAITKSDGTTQIYAEVEQWDSTNEKALLWVSKSDLTLTAASATELYIYYDASQADNTTYIGTPGNRPEVWHSDFAAVYTMAQDPSGGTDCIIDSSGNGNHGTPAGSMTSADLVDGLIGKALDFDGSDDEIDLGTGLDLDTFAWEVLWQSNDTSYSNERVLLSNYNGSDDVYSFNIDADAKIDFLRHGDGVITGATDLSGISDWVLHTAVNDPPNNNSLIYKDGAQDAAGDIGAATAYDKTRIGRGHSAYSPWYGKIASVRAYDAIPSAAWIKADYHAQTDNLLTWGAEESSGIFSCDSGAFILTGKDASFIKVTTIFSVDYGTLSVTGQDSSLLYYTALSADTGMVTIAGTASLLYHRIMEPAVASFDITGNDAALTRLLRAHLSSGAVEIEGLLNPSLLARWQETVTLRDNLSQQLRTSAFIYDELTGFDMGPVVVSDPSDGLYARAWKVLVSNRDMYLYGANGSGWMLDRYLTSSDTFPTSSVDLTWDQNGRPFVCWEEDGMVWIYYYNPVAEEMTRLELCAGRTPKAKLDVRRSRLSDVSDILLFYLNDTADCLEYRTQSDRYTVAYQITEFSDVSAKYLELLAMGSNWRLYLWYTEYDSAAETWTLSYWHSAPYPYVMDDEEVVLVSDGVRSATLVTIFLTASLEPESVELTEDAIVSAVLRSVMHAAELEESVELTEDTIPSATLRTAILTTDIDDESVELTEDTIQSATLVRKILETTMDDESIELTSDTIRSATLT